MQTPERAQSVDPLPGNMFPLPHASSSLREGPPQSPSPDLREGDPNQTRLTLEPLEEHRVPPSHFTEEEAEPQRGK